MSKPKRHWVMDFETLVNCFVACFQHYRTDEKREFVIHALRNDIVPLLDFLEEKRNNNEWHISFNGLAFDGQITQMLLREGRAMSLGNPEFIANRIYQKAQDCISRSNNKDWQEFSERDMSIRQIDVYKLNHWDNHAKRSSLKWIQYSMDWYNMQEMPIHHSTFIRTQEEIDIILEYCKNDVSSTKRIMELSRDQINLRGTLTGEYGINLYNASEPRISKELFMLFLSEKIGISNWELKRMRTNRPQIRVSDILLPYIDFKTRTFKDLLSRYRSLVITPPNFKNVFKYNLSYRGVKAAYGLGGMHGAIVKRGVYESGDGMIIMSSDVKSFYPNLAIRNGWAPAHLPREAFCEQYEWFYDERVKIPKKDIRNYVYKIILNATFGLSIEPNSFLYDPQFGMQVTINGQLLLSMLYEMLCEAIPGAMPLMLNTDGMEISIPEDSRNTYMDICAKWEKLTSLQLEHDTYSKIILADVNSYMAVPSDPAKRVKCKGRFEFEDLALHKDKSCLIVRKALHAYFIHDVPPERFLSENRNIFDYCSGIKIKETNWKFKQICVREGRLIEEDLPKIVRYYTSNSGCKIIKKNISDGRQIMPEAGKWVQTVFNRHEGKEWKDYDVNDQYYLDMIYREIANVAPPKSQQLTLL